MILVRAAADRTRSDIAAAPLVASIPGSAAAAIAESKDEARRRRPDYGKLVAHLSRAVRQAILLEACIGRGRLPDLMTHASHPPAAPPGERAPHPDRDHPHRETLDRLDVKLPTGALGQAQVEDLLHTIGARFGLQLPPPPEPPRPDHPGAAPHAATNPPTPKPRPPDRR